VRLFHFSEDPAIERFVPRPVLVPSVRPPGRDWLNGPLVWAIDEQRQPMYLFPRDCPRILLWTTPDTTPSDRARWWGEGDWSMVAHIEQDWVERVRTARIYRYEFPAEAFEDLHDAGMWIARSPVEPLRMEVIGDLPAALRDRGVDLRVVESLVPLKGVWSTSLHASGIRLRHAKGWLQA